LKDSEAETRRSKVLNKILQHPAAKQEPEDGEDRQNFEDARSRDNIHLELRFCNGKRSFFSLVELGETDFDPGERDIITLRFNRANVTVIGRGLVTLYELLLDQRARFIEQNTEAEGELMSTAQYVESMEIQRNDE
jgi:hypothetical protein